MKKTESILAILLISIIVITITQCIDKDGTIYNPKVAEINDTMPGTNLNTILGNNYFTLTAGGITMIPFITTVPSDYFQGAKGKADLSTATGYYVISMQSVSSMLGYANVFLKSKPETNKILTLVSEEKPLTDSTASITLTIIKSNKTWRSIKGKLKVFADSTSAYVSFDSVRVECTSNNTDTTYYWMKGEVYGQ